MAVAVVGVAEYLRSRPDLTIEVPFAFEWAVAAAMMAAILVGTAAVLTLFGAPAPGLGPLLVKLLGSVAVYPIFVFLGRVFFGAQRSTRSEYFGFGSER